MKGMRGAIGLSAGEAMGSVTMGVALVLALLLPAGPAEPLPAESGRCGPIMRMRVMREELMVATLKYNDSRTARRARMTKQHKKMALAGLRGRPSDVGVLNGTTR